jgi:hypothetical protein
MDPMEPKPTDAAPFDKLWSISEFCERYRIEDMERRRLLMLFGEYGTAAELLHNVRRAPRFR